MARPEQHIIRASIIVGAVAGSVVPFISGGASVRFFTDIEARIGYGVFAAAVFAIFGAIVGWAIGSLLGRSFERRREMRP